MTKLPNAGKDWVPIAPVRAHVQALRDQGITLSAIAQAAPMDPTTLFNVMVTSPTKRVPVVRHRLLRSTAAPLLALTPEVIDGTAARVPTQVMERALWTPIEPVRDHIRTLQASGMTISLIAEECNVTSRHLVAITTTNHAAAQAVTQGRVSASVARRILAVKPGRRSPQQTIDAGPTNRRLQALLVAGYTHSMIGAMVGSRAKVIRPKVTQPDVRVEFADRVARAYSAHAFTPPRYGTDAARSHGRRLAAAARTQGWLGPFEWDDIDVGTLLHAPESTDIVIDQVAVDFAIADCLAGISRSSVIDSLTREEQDAALAALLVRGVSYAEIAKRLRISDRRAADAAHALQGDRHGVEVAA